MNDSPQLYHYTCTHGRSGLGDLGELVPPGRLFAEHAALLPVPMKALSRLIWLTDLEVPHRDALGLTSNRITCRRTDFRYRVLDAGDARPWLEARTLFDPVMVTRLESTPGVMPRHWWIATQPVRVQYAPTVAG